ncbi:LemA family protein [Kaistella jeonii]|uniref:Membrane protein n=1 Tax=Kaistella jeonii TaxID=266749 RepID=A0A0C1CN61_9FLAO|nr:LemA family protein [Kaistella jeonii]KIA85451.1 membrane protein [Kaistella jeonii]SFC42586.1 LemA protein [Kaistella jeonii]VEI96802.1 LemA family [Kaistella jeonii]
MIIALLIFVVVIVTVFSFVINSFNQIVILKNNVDKSFSNIDVILKQRNDEVPNLVNVVKATALYENTILKDLTALRSQYLKAEKTNDKIKIAEQMNSQMKSFFVTAENYPELKATQSFLALQMRLSDIENMIADRREYFNESVNLYNIRIGIFPDFIFAKLMNYKNMQMLTFSDAEVNYEEVKIN